MLQAVATKMGYDQQYINLARGLFGDIIVTQVLISGTGASVFHYSELASCEDNPEDPEGMMKALIDNNAKARPSDPTGGCVNAASGGLQTMVGNNLQNIVDKMKTKTALTTTETGILQRVNLPLFPTLKSAIATGQESSTIAVMTDATSKAYAYAMVRDLVNMMAHAVSTAQDIKNKNSRVGADCQMDVFEPAFDLLKNFQPDVVGTLKLLYGSYLASLEEINVSLEVAAKYEQFEKKSKNELGILFSPAVANRAVR